MKEVIYIHLFDRDPIMHSPKMNAILKEFDISWTGWSDLTEFRVKYFNRIIHRVHLLGVLGSVMNEIILAWIVVSLISDSSLIL